MAINPINHVFEVTAGKECDLVIAETNDTAIAKFEKITTIMGKKIDTKKIKAEFLYTIK